MLWDPSGDTTTHSGIANGIVWSCIGIAAAISLGVAKGPDGIVSAILGALLGVTAFYIIAMFVFTTVQTGLPIPSATQFTPWYVVRFLWGFLPIATIGLFLSRASNAPKSSTANDISTGEHKGEG